MVRITSYHGDDSSYEDDGHHHSASLPSSPHGGNKTGSYHNSRYHNRPPQHRGDSVKRHNDSHSRQRAPKRRGYTGKGKKPYLHRQYQRRPKKNQKTTTQSSKPSADSNVAELLQKILAQLQQQPAPQAKTIPKRHNKPDTAQRSLNPQFREQVRTTNLYIRLKHAQANWQKLPRTLDQQISKFVDVIKPPKVDDDLTAMLTKTTNNYKNHVRDIVITHIGQQMKSALDLIAQRDMTDIEDIHRIAWKQVSFTNKKVPSDVRDETLTDILSTRKRPNQAVEDPPHTIGGDYETLSSSPDQPFVTQKRKKRFSTDRSPVETNTRPTVESPNFEPPTHNRFLPLQNLRDQEELTHSEAMEFLENSMSDDEAHTPSRHTSPITKQQKVARTLVTAEIHKPPSAPDYQASTSPTLLTLQQLETENQMHAHINISGAHTVTDELITLMVTPLPAAAITGATVEKHDEIKPKPAARLYSEVLASASKNQSPAVIDRGTQQAPTQPKPRLASIHILSSIDKRRCDLKCVNPEVDTIIFSDSNGRQWTSAPASWEIFVFPGAHLNDVERMLTCTAIPIQIKHLIIAVGINERNQRTDLITRRLVHVASFRQKCMGTTLYFLMVPQHPNFTPSQAAQISHLNKTAHDLFDKDFIVCPPTGQIIPLTPDDQVHYSKETADAVINRVIKHIQSLN